MSEYRDIDVLQRAEAGHFAIGAFLAGGLTWATAALAGARPGASFLTGAAVGLGTGLIGAGYSTARQIFDDWHSRRLRVQHDALALDAERQRVKLDSIRQIEPDQYGRVGVFFDGHVFRDADSKAGYDMMAVRYLDPILEQLNHQHKMLTALVQQNVPQHYVYQVKGGEQAARLPETAGAGLVQWPANLRLADIFQDRQATINDVVVGARPSAAGLDIVSGAIHNLTHILCVGSSGWGKSTWLRAFIWQLAQAQEPLEVVAIDTSGSEFNALQGWAKLRYPVARSTNDAMAELLAVKTEIDNRKAMFEGYPLVTKLSEYNQATGANLPVLFVVVDEGTNLLAEPTIGDALRGVVQTARQYGICAVLAGQSANYKVIPTQVRDNFSARVCFHTSPTSSQVVLDDRRACDLRDKGRALVQLPGADIQEVQTPYIDRDAFMQILTKGKPGAMPTLESEQLDDPQDDPTLPNDERARRLVQAGVSKRQTCLRVYGATGGAAWDKLEKALAG